jgi:hypothetical protein
MRKSEHFIPPDPAQVALGGTYNASALVQGTNGPITASYPSPYLATQSFAACVSVMRTALPSLPLNTDLGATRFFYSDTPGAQDVPRGNKRGSSAAGYVYPFLANGRKLNLDILVGSTGTKILWAPSSSNSTMPATGALVRATGVQFVSSGTDNLTRG